MPTSQCVESGRGPPERGKEVLLEDALASAGLGRFHACLVLACGLGFAAAAVEVVLIGFLIAELRDEWKDSELMLSLLPTCSSLGSMLGGLGWGWVADAYGRRPVFLVTVIIVVIFGVLSAFSHGMVVLICFRVLVSLGYGGNISTDFTLFVEMLPTHRRGEFIFALQAFWPMGQTLTVGIAWLTIPRLGWRGFLVACAVPSLLTCFLRPWIPESPRWLLLHGREEEAIEVCRQIGEFNGVSAEDMGLAHGSNVRLLRSSEAEKLTSPAVADKDSASCVPALLSKGLWRTTVGCMIFEGMLCFGGYATTTFMPSLLQMKHMEGMGMYASMLVSSLSQFPGILAVVYCSGRCGRLGPIYASLLLQAIPLAIFAFVKSYALLIICSCLASCAAEFGWALIHVYVPEVFPTEVRALATGVVASVGSTISLCAPLLTAGLLRAGSAGLAVFVFAAVLALGSLALMSLLHVETLDRDLADTASR